MIGYTADASHRRCCPLVPMTPTDPPRRQPTDPDASPHADVSDVAAHLSEATAASLPLTAGLRAAAEDDVSRPLARALRQLAERLERGVPFADAIGQLHTHAPRRARAMLLAANSRHDFASILTAILDQERAENGRRREMWQALAYPAVLMLLSYIVFMGMYFIVLPLMQIAINDVYSANSVYSWNSGSDSTLESLQLVFEVHLMVRWLLLVGGVTFLIVTPLVRLFLGGSLFGRMVHRIPVIGSLWYFSRLASWLELLAVLLRSRVPLPEALRLTATACHSSLEPATRRAAENVERGQSLPLALNAAGTFPASLALFCGATDSGSPLTSVVERTAEAFRQRFRHRVELVSAVARPIAFLVVAIAMAVMFTFITRSTVEVLRFLS